MVSGPIVAIVGATASGKSSLALQIAQQFNGEIIAADSRTVYKGMDIGTAKPTKAEQAQVPHHLIDVVTPDQSFTVADFKRLADQAITDIQARGKLPILVGGTGLYVDAVLYGFEFRPVDAAKRQVLEKLSVEELQAQVEEQGLPMPTNQQNPRHLVRTLESAGAVGKRNSLRQNTLFIGLQLDNEVLKSHIKQRVDQMFQNGFIAEANALGEEYGWEVSALQAPGYKAIHQYLNGDRSIEEAKQMFVRNDWLLAKRQRTWFKRNPDIQWFNNSEQAVHAVEAFLTTKHQD